MKKVLQPRAWYHRRNEILKLAGDVDMHNLCGLYPCRLHGGRATCQHKSFQRW